MDEVIIREVDDAELEEVVRLHRRAYPARERRRSIFTSQKVARYLAAARRHPAVREVHSVVGAWRSGRLLGYAHLRPLTDSWHLNYVVVAEEKRGEGVGNALLDAWKEGARFRGYARLTLDVEAAKPAVVEWYKRSGLEIESQRWQYERPLQSAADAPEAPVRLRGWEHAEASQAYFGFSMFRVEADGQAVDVGRLGTRLYQTYCDPPDVIERVLLQMDPVRRLLITSDSELASLSSWEVGIFYRMGGTLSQAGMK